MLDAHQAVRSGALRPTEVALSLKTRIGKAEEIKALCMDAVRGPFARNTAPNSASYTAESCFVSSGHSARDQTIG